ncbi:MAG TPA: isocitrate/isopropylmalate family dehydrogenase, partial [Methanomicrobiales archaeon]|nr:isocitrate/isopropylmalate family dehydrogenase [Methanomicrobiales archaeon]
MPRWNDVAAIGGDGIGPEIIAEGKKVLDAAGERYGFEIRWKDLDIGAGRYLRTGELLTEDDLTTLGRCRAIYFGAIGDERV